MAEVRGKHFDRRLEKSFARLYKHGSTFVRKDVVQRCLTSSKLKLKTKEKNITGLQIADILAHPSALYIRSKFVGDVTPSGFGEEVANLLVASKYNRNHVGDFMGRGVKWLP